MSVPSSQTDFAAAGQPSRSFVQAVRQQQIIHFALATGATFFAAVTLFITKGNLNGPLDTVTIALVGMAGLNFLAHVFVPKVIRTQLLKSISKQDLKSMSSEDREMTVFVALNRPNFIGTAILDGATFTCLIAYMIEQWVGSLAIAAAFIVLIILRTPSVYGIQNKVNDRIQEIEMS